MSKVESAIDYLKKQDPNDDIVFIVMTRDEFISEYVAWVDDDSDPTIKELPNYLTKEVWERIADGIYQDDRVQEALMDSARYDFDLIQRKLEVQLNGQDEQELWEG